MEDKSRVATVELRDKAPAFSRRGTIDFCVSFKTTPPSKSILSDRRQVYSMSVGPL